MQLRPYQEEILDQARSLMKQGVRGILIQSPTGSGKTLLTAQMLKTAGNKGMSSWFNVHRRELIKQSSQTFLAMGVPHGVIGAGWTPDTSPFIQVAGVQSLLRRHLKQRRPRLIVWDECHHIAASSWSRLFREYPDAFHVGLTATPLRLDGSGLDQWFSHMVRGPSVRWLIEQGYLSPYRLYAPGTIDLSKIAKRMGDYVRSEIDQAVNKPTITGDAIREYNRRCNGKRAVVFAVSIKHSMDIVEQFRAAGIAAEHVDGESHAEYRDAAIERFRVGRTQVLSNVELFGEGFDLPAMEAAILLRPTQSLGLYLQQVGRVLRTSPGKKEAIILDHVGNCERHGLPCEERQWSLAGQDQSSRSTREGPCVRVCPRCYAAQPPYLTSCQYCLFVFAVEPREVEHVEGNLEEIDPALFRKQVQGKTETLQDLIELGKTRKYKNPYLWAKHVFNARQRKKLGWR